MAKAKGKKKAAKKNPSASHKKAKPAKVQVIHVNTGPKKKPKKNPGGKPKLNARWAATTATQAAIGAGVAFAGMTATREIPQLIWQQKNVGNIGLAMNIGAGIVSTWAVAQVSKKWAAAWGTGAALAVAQRFVSERTMPVPAATSSPEAGVGDVMTIAAAKRSLSLVPANHPAVTRTVQGSMARGTSANRPLAAAA